MTIVLIEKTIENVKFELKMNTNAHKRSIGGLPCLFINGEPHLVYDVDLADVIRAINNSQNLIYVKKGVKDLWCGDAIIETCTIHEKENGLI